VRRPVTLWFSKKSSRSFENIANKKGTSFHLVYAIITWKIIGFTVIKNNV
jgi:hypothetical protein